MQEDEETARAFQLREDLEGEGWIPEETCVLDDDHVDPVEVGGDVCVWELGVGLDGEDFLVEGGGDGVGEQVFATVRGPGDDEDEGARGRGRSSSCWFDLGRVLCLLLLRCCMCMCVCVCRIGAVRFLGGHG